MKETALLKLDFLATGTWQHVFVNHDEDDAGWVYKVPSAFGYILPFKHAQRFRASSVAARVGGSLAAQTPFISRMYAARLRRVCLKNFEHMLALIETIEGHGLSDILLPCATLRDTAVVLEVEGVTVYYRGPLLRQRRADFLFERSENLGSFEWREVVEAHHRLWRCGVTFSTTTAVLELKNWALLDGRLRLFDTSSLTRDPRSVRGQLNEAELDRREAAVLRRTAERNSQEPLLDYFRFVRRELNRDKLDQLWEADLDFKH